MKALPIVALACALSSLAGCSSIKVVEPSVPVDVPTFNDCKPYALLKGKTFKDALDTILENKKIYLECQEIVAAQKKVLKTLANQK